jgi:hypothetical protein
MRVDAAPVERVATWLLIRVLAGPADHWLIRVLEIVHAERACVAVDLIEIIT